MFNFIICTYSFYCILLQMVPVSTMKTTKSLYDMADDYEDDKNSAIAISDKDKDNFYDDFYLEKDIEYKHESSMDIIFYGPPESFMRLDAETILHILSNIRLKHLIPVNKVLQSWDIITDGRTAAYLHGREYLAFGPLLNFVPEEDLYYVNMGDRNVRAYFARFSQELHFRKFGILVAAYRRYFGNTWYLNATSVNELGYMICGFPPNELRKITPAIMKELKSSVLGKLRKCNDKQVQTLYDLAIQPEVFGEPYRWTSHEVSRMGSLLKCIPADQLSSIQLEAMPAITEEVIKQFSQQKLTQFTKQQIMKMRPLTRRIYILRVQLLSSFDVNELSKHAAAYNNESFILLVVCFLYIILIKIFVY
ncbi:uncharacterized protein LOC134667734 [Cydia fagiglandana]|uniref:uncharacterized protein LOC134667734 n=1 Tax=Cydia fagiglandana TaxID=1458189 RepID=UPI002FEE5D65